MVNMYRNCSLHLIDHLTYVTFFFFAQTRLQVTDCRWCSEKLIPSITTDPVISFRV